MSKRKLFIPLMSVVVIIAVAAIYVVHSSAGVRSTSGGIGNLKTLSLVDEGTAVLDDCAKIECVRAKADQLAAAQAAAAKPQSSSGHTVAYSGAKYSSQNSCDSACQYQKAKTASAARLKAQMDAEAARDTEYAKRFEQYMNCLAGCNNNQSCMARCNQ
ncbi:MAG: hypothetical protein ACYCXU_09545 [Thermoleophilia bacterium]